MSLSKPTEQPRVIAAVARLTGMDTEAARGLTRNAPTVILTDLTRDQQEEALAKLRRAGAPADASWTYRRAE